MSKIEDAVIAKINARAAAGAIKYGVSMERGDLSRLDWLNHLQQELIDGLAYIEKLIQLEESSERREAPAESIPWAECPGAAWAIACEQGCVHFNTSARPPYVVETGWKHAYGGWVDAHNATIPGPWQESLRARPAGI
jgi:hypothetical protein